MEFGAEACATPQVEEERKFLTPLTPSAMKTEPQGGFTNRELLAYNLLTDSKRKLLSKLILELETHSLPVQSMACQIQNQLLESL